MARLRAGFTIIEVLLVMAITGLIFFSAITMFSGKRSQTEFDQAMYDLESEIQSMVNSTKSGTFQDSSQYICVIRPNGQPAVRIPQSGDPSPSDPGAHSDCLTLGRAVQARPSDDKLYIFTVIGVAKENGDGQPVSSLEGAAPSVIIGNHASGGPSGNRTDLTLVYKILSGVTLVSATVPGQPEKYEIAGFYLAPSGGSSAGQGSTFTALAYPFTSSSDDIYTDNREADRIEHCVLQESSASLNIDCENPVTMGRWDLCVESEDGQRRAVLSLSSAPDGITTKVEFRECS